MEKEVLLQEANELKDELVEIRRKLHQMPGCGFDTKETLEFVRNKLIEYGVEPKQCGKAGLSVLIGKDSGKVFLLRADMDGLPMKEEAEVDYASKNGKMHACGHDLHTAMLLGAAKLLKQHEDEIEGQIKLMFQSAEEIFEGANDMIEQGILENPQVDAAMMIHVVAGMPMPTGTVVVSSPGVTSPAADLFEIEIQGKGCHGSMPNTGVDPLIPAAHLLLALQEIQTRELSVSEKAVLTIGCVEAGSAPNIIPDKAVLKGSLRTYDEQVRSQMKQRLSEMSESLAKVFRTSAKVTFTSGCPTLFNDEKLCHDIYASLHDLLGDKAAAPFLQKNAGNSGSGSGSEDFAYISQKVPSVMLAIAAGDAKDGYLYSQHHPKVMFDEAVLPVGSAVFADSAINWLKNHK